MPNWRRIIVGDAFKLPSREGNYYRDLFLLFPFFLFAIAGIALVLDPGHSGRMLGAKYLMVALVVLALARERLILLFGVLGFCALRLLFALIVTRDSRVIVGLLVTGVPFVLGLRLLRNYKPSYELPQGVTLFDLVIGLTSLVLTLASFQLFRQ